MKGKPVGQPDVPPPFDLTAEVARIDQRRARLHVEMDRAHAAASASLWPWALWLVVVIVAGVVLGLAL